MQGKGILEKIDNDIPLDRDESLYLINDCSLHFLGEMADKVNQKKNNSKVFFNINRHINLTNVCVSRCKFCAFSKDKDEEGSYVMSVDDVARRVEESLPMGISEVHIVSGLHPDLPFEYYLEVLSRVKEIAPDIHIQGFTAVEIDYFSKLYDMPVSSVLIKMQEAGLGSLPGGGAEIFSARVREELCPKKATAHEWLNVMQEAHGLGLKSNATMLFGHIETPEERVDHLIALRDLQEKTGRFQSFIPLPFHPKNTMMQGFERPNRQDILRVLAASRIILNNFQHIKAFWIMMGIRLAQLSLYYGVNDLDGTVVEERITHSAGAVTPEEISSSELVELIKESGRTPVQRDTLYNELKVYS